MYDEIKKISVAHSPSIELVVSNPTTYKMINKGAHGAVFRLNEESCVKIYADRINAELEAKSYMAAQETGLVPCLIETGENYNIIEYIGGPNLYDYLKETQVLKIETTLKIMKALDKMKAAGFTRIDAALWHFLFDKNEELKLIDIVYAMVRNDPYPVKILTGMKELGLLNVFLEHVRIIDEREYQLWESSLGMFFDQ